MPTILTSVVADRGGRIFPKITDVFPGQEIIDRTLINTWEDPKVVDVVKATGRKQLVLLDRVAGTNSGSVSETTRRKDSLAEPFENGG